MGREAREWWRWEADWVVRRAEARLWMDGARTDQGGAEWSREEKRVCWRVRREEREDCSAVGVELRAREAAWEEGGWVG